MGELNTYRQLDVNDVKPNFMQIEKKSQQTCIPTGRGVWVIAPAMQH